MSIVNVSILELVKLANIVVEACKAVKEDGSPAQYQTVLRNNEALTCALKQAKEQLEDEPDSDKHGTHEFDFSSVIAELECNQQKLQQEYGTTLGAPPTAGFKQKLARVWKSLHWAFRDARSWRGRLRRIKLLSMLQSSHQ